MLYRPRKSPLRNLRRNPQKRPRRGQSSRQKDRPKSRRLRKNQRRRLLPRAAPQRRKRLGSPLHQGPRRHRLTLGRLPQRSPRRRVGPHRVRHHLGDIRQRARCLRPRTTTDTSVSRLRGMKLLGRSVQRCGLNISRWDEDVGGSHFGRFARSTSDIAQTGRPAAACGGMSGLPK